EVQGDWRRSEVSLRLAVRRSSSGGLRRSREGEAYHAARSPRHGVGHRHTGENAVAERLRPAVGTGRARHEDRYRDDDVRHLRAAGAGWRAAAAGLRVAEYGR